MELSNIATTDFRGPRRRQIDREKKTLAVIQSSGFETFLKLLYRSSRRTRNLLKSAESTDFATHSRTSPARAAGARPTNPLRDVTDAHATGIGQRLAEWVRCGEARAAIHLLRRAPITPSPKPAVAPTKRGHSFRRSGTVVHARPPGFLSPVTWAGR